MGLFSLVKNFYGYRVGSQPPANNPGVGGPQGNPYGTASMMESWPSIVRGPMWVIAPIYGFASTAVAPVGGPNKRSGKHLIAIPGYQKAQTYSDIQF